MSESRPTLAGTTAAEPRRVDRSAPEYERGVRACQACVRCVDAWTRAARANYTRADVRKILARVLGDDWLGVHFAANIFIATTVLWVLLRLAAGLNPIWAISSMIAASDPNVQEAFKTFRGRIINAGLGCVTGLFFLIIGRGHDWTLPVALSVTVLLSTYVVRVQVMWRQAPITAALVIAAVLTHHSELTAVEVGVRRVGEVMLGCVVGLAVTWVMSRIWPVPAPAK